MAADHVVVAFTTNNKQLAGTVAAEVTDTQPSCCAHIEGPVRSVHRWHGQVFTNEEWRVEVETTAETADALVEHIRTHHGDEVNDLVVRNNIAHLHDDTPSS